MVEKFSTLIFQHGQHTKQVLVVLLRIGCSSNAKVLLCMGVVQVEAPLPSRA